MLSIEHIPTKEFYNNYLMEASSIEEALKVMIPRIRTISQDFYRKSLEKDLSTKGEGIVDQHAGNGNFYTIKIT